MNKQKKLIIILILAFSIGAGTFLVSPVNAKGTSAANEVIERLSKRFSLNQNEVKSVFDEIRSEHHEKRIALLKGRLSEMVKNGQITEAQKTELLSLISTNKENMERGEEKQERKSLLRDWAKKNNINLKSIFANYKEGRGK